MRHLQHRVHMLEQQREQAAPSRPCLVLLPGQDEATELAAFRAHHGCEPEGVVRIQAASARLRDAPMQE